MSDTLRALLGDKLTSKFVEAGPDECWPWTACINKRITAHQDVLDFSGGAA